MSALSAGGTARRRRLEAPLRKVTAAMKSLKFPILSATAPANGGASRSATGTAVFTRAASYSMYKERQRETDFSNTRPNVCNVIFAEYNAQRRLSKCARNAQA